MPLYFGEDLISKVVVTSASTAEVPTQEKTVTPTRATQIVEPDTAGSYLSKVTVNPIPASYILESEVTLQEKSVTPQESAQTIEADSAYMGLSKVNVAAITNEYFTEILPLFNIINIIINISKQNNNISSINFIGIIYTS